jgi:hypothetical protein
MATLAAYFTCVSVPSFYTGSVFVAECGQMCVVYVSTASRDFLSLRPTYCHIDVAVAVLVRVWIFTE